MLDCAFGAGYTYCGFTDPNTGAQILPRCFPENYFVANPQLQAAQYAKNLGYTIVFWL